MRRILVSVALVAAAMTLAGCSASAGSESSIGSAPQAQGFGKAEVATGGTDSSASTTSIAIERQVEITGTEVIRAKNPISAGDTAAQLTEAAGGRVDDRTQTAATKHTTATASLTLRIPQDKLTATLDQLKHLGTVVSIKLSSKDVTTKSEDLNARIDALRTSIARLMKLEAKAGSTTSLLAIEDDISTRQGDLESLTAQQRYLGDQVAMSTVSLRLIAPNAPVAAPKTPSPANAFFAGWSGFGTFFTWVFLVLSYLFPWLLLAAVVTAAIIVPLKIRKRRAAAKTPATPVATA